MKRQAPKRVIDTIVILLVFAIPVASSVLGYSSWFGNFGRGATALSALLAMPEAGMEVMMNEARTIIDEHSQDPDPLPEDYVQPPQHGNSLDDLSDLEAAMQVISESDRMPIETAQYASVMDGDNFFMYGSGCIRNATNYSTSEMQEAANGQLPFDLQLNSKEPQVLVMHTHSTESYDRFDAGFYDVNYPTRSTDINENINEVGRVLTERLNALGINAIQATEYHDYPSYDNSYSRSRVTVQNYLDMYPSIKIVLDVHRDGIQREDGTRVKPTAVVEGKKAAQIMIVCGAESSDIDLPNFRENLKFAARLQDSAETLYPGFTRPLYLAYRYYNQDLTTGSVLVEVGSESNTLAEAKYTGELIANALANLFHAG